MASVIDFIECPNCKQEAYYELYYKSGQEYTFCSSCGYTHSVSIKNQDKKISELTKDDYIVKEVKHPYCAYTIKLYSGSVFKGSIKNKKEFNYFSEASAVDVEIEYCSISRLVDGKIVTETIIDNGPAVDSSGFTVEDR